MAVLFTLFAVLPAIALAKLEINRGSTHSPAILPAPAPLSGPVVVSLIKTPARKQGRGSDVSFYVGEMSVGHPAQKLKVVFDTASGNVIMPHSACRSRTCREHSHFSPWMSSTAMDVQANGSNVKEGSRYAAHRSLRDAVTVVFSQSDLGEGKVEAVLVRDHVCMQAESSQACLDMVGLAGLFMEDRPFRYMPSDAIVGLGLPALASGPDFSFLGRLFEGSTNVVPQFGIALGSARGELHLGGHGSARLAAPVRWFPVDHSDAGFWQVAIQAVRVGNRTVDTCKKGCHGIIDSAVSQLGVQMTKYGMMRTALESVVTRQGRCGGPDLTFDLGGMNLTLTARDYAGRNCIPLLGSLDLPEPEYVGVYAFGTALLQRYYTAFDWKEERLGFAPLEGNFNMQLHSQPTAGMLMV